MDAFQLVTIFFVCLGEVNVCMRYPLIEGTHLFLLVKSEEKRNNIVLCRNFQNLPLTLCVGGSSIPGCEMVFVL